MTREEFYEKYGEIKVKFLLYYKYTFTYRAELDDGCILICDYGGNRDDIYKFTVNNNTEISVNDLCPYAGEIHKDGEKIESFYDYY